MMREWSGKARAALLLAAMAIVLPSCDGGGGGGTTTGPPTPTRIVLGTLSFSLGVEEGAFADATITGSGSGTLDATANWTFASNDVDIYITNTSCANVFLGSCPFLAKADSTTAKPERVTLNVSAGNTYRVWVVNFGPGTESGTLEVGLTR